MYKAFYTRWFTFPVHSWIYLKKYIYSGTTSLDCTVKVHLHLCALWSVRLCAPCHVNVRVFPVMGRQLQIRQVGSSPLSHPSSVFCVGSANLLFPPISAIWDTFCGQNLGENGSFLRKLWQFSPFGLFPTQNTEFLHCLALSIRTFTWQEAGRTSSTVASIAQV